MKAESKLFHFFFIMANVFFVSTVIPRIYLVQCCSFFESIYMDNHTRFFSFLTFIWLNTEGNFEGLMNAAFQPESVLMKVILMRMIRNIIILYSIIAKMISIFQYKKVSDRNSLNLNTIQANPVFSNIRLSIMSEELSFFVSLEKLPLLILKKYTKRIF